MVEKVSYKLEFKQWRYMTTFYSKGPPNFKLISVAIKDISYISTIDNI